MEMLEHEQRGAEIGLQLQDMGANRGLGDMKSLGRLEEAAMRSDGQKGFCLVDIHRFLTYYAC